MNITKFFNLSIAEIEEYLKSCQVYDLFCNNYYCQGDIEKKMGLLGKLNYKFGYLGKIHIQKKSNLYGVFNVELYKVEQKYWVSFSLYYSESVYLMKIVISPLTRRIDYVEINKEMYWDRTRTLADIIQEKI